MDALKPIGKLRDFQWQSTASAISVFLCSLSIGTGLAAHFGKLDLASSRDQQ